MADLIGANDLTSLRVQIDQRRTQAGLSAFPWTDSLSSNTPIKARHFQEIRAATQDLWLMKGIAPFQNWTSNANPRSDTSVMQTQNDDVKHWWDTFVLNPDPLRAQGIVSPSANEDGAIITDTGPQQDNWREDGYDLKQAGGRLLVRSAVKAPAGGGDPDAGPYATGANRWKARGMGVGFVLGPEIYDQNDDPIFPNATLSPDSEGRPTNAYITEFSRRARNFVDTVADEGHRTFWIWNEPQAAPSAEDIPPSGTPADNIKWLCSQNFAALVHRTADEIKKVGATRVYVGSLQILPDTGPNLSWEYIEAMYPALTAYGITADKLRWDGFSLNMHQKWEDQTSYLDTFLSNMRRVFATAGELNPNLIVSEWGFRHNEIEYQKNGVPPKLKNTFDALRARFPVMYFLSHDRFSDTPPETYGMTRSQTVDNDIKPKNVNDTDSPHYLLHNSPPEPDPDRRTLWDKMKDLYSSVP